MVEEALQRGADGVCTSTHIDDGAREQLFVFHTIRIGSSSLEPLLHHVFTNIGIVLSCFYGCQCSIKDMITWSEAEVIDEWVCQQDVMQPVVVPYDSDIQSQESSVGNGATNVSRLVKEAKRPRESDLSKNVEAKAMSN